MTFPKNNLPTQSQPWTRDVEKRVTNLESTFRSAEVNNVTRDSQALSQIRRLDAAVISSSEAITKVQGVIDNIYVPGTEQIDGAVLAQNTIDGTAVVNGSLPAGKIQANSITANQISTNYVYAGQINAGQINAGTVNGLNITGGTLATSGTRRVEISGTNANFFDSNGTLSGRVTAGENGRAATMYFGTGISGVFAYNGGMDLEANGQVRVTGGNGFSSAGPISGTSISGSSISNSGTYTGNGFPTIGANTVSGTGFPANTFVATNGNMARKTDASERRLKENIENFEFDTEAFIGVNPVTFNYKRDAVSTDEQAQALNVGFILDDFEEAGLSDFLVYQAEGDSFKQLRYDLLAIYLHKVVQTQNQTIKSLEARITALESRV